MSFAIVQHLGNGMLGQSASHARENLILAWPSDKANLLTLLLLHIPSGAGRLASHCSPPPEGPRPMDCSKRSLRSCEAEPPIMVAGAAA
jgi:hypothetical protein